MNIKIKTTTDLLGFGVVVAGSRLRRQGSGSSGQPCHCGVECCSVVCRAFASLGRGWGLYCTYPERWDLKGLCAVFVLFSWAWCLEAFLESLPMRILGVSN